MNKTPIKQIWDLVLKEDWRSIIKDLDDYKTAIIMERNKEFGFIPEFVEDYPFGYFRVKHEKTGKVYFKNQLSRIIEYSIKKGTF